MRLKAFLTCALMGAGTQLCADTDLTELTAAERAAFRAEIRALLLEEPEIVARALAGPSPYADAVDSDLARINAYADILFSGGAAVAVITSPNCPSCDRAVDELRELTGELGVTFNEINGAENPDLIADLDLGVLPTYVLPDMMVRDHVPPIVLRRYLTR